MNHHSTISSITLGVNAYRKAQGHIATRPAATGITEYTRQTTSGSARGVRTHQDAKEVKISVLRSLQARSNSGSVKIRDVSSALDDLLRRV